MGATTTTRRTETQQSLPNHTVRQTQTNFPTRVIHSNIGSHFRATKPLTLDQQPPTTYVEEEGIIKMRGGFIKLIRGGLLSHPFPPAVAGEGDCHPHSRGSGWAGCAEQKKGYLVRTSVPGRWSPGRESSTFSEHTDTAPPLSLVTQRAPYKFDFCPNRTCDLCKCPPLVCPTRPRQTYVSF
jgi:hypothetical protein